MNELVVNSNKREQTAAVFLDVKKAYDKIWHDDHLFKTAKMEITLNIIEIVESFLKDRSFGVK